jgi:hypothetical protein
MRASVAQHITLFLVVGAIGAVLLARSSAAQQYRPATGYAFWNKADDTTKLVYLTGYSDAEQFYRLAIDTRMQPICGDDGKKSIAEFEYRFPLPKQATLAQEKQGIDEFYKDWRNQSIALISAQNIIRQQILGRPQAEIDAYIARSRSGQN